jgi:hypothetical protein
MQFDAECSQDSENSYVECRLTSSMIDSSSETKPTTDGKSVVYCTMKNGHLIPAEVAVEDVVLALQEMCDIDVLPCGECMPGVLQWRFQCSTEDLTHFVGENVAAKRHILKFSVDEVAPSHAAHVWYCCADGKSMPNNITPELIVSFVKANADVELTFMPVPAAVQDAPLAPPNALVFSCALSELSKLRTEITARFKLKRCELVLWVAGQEQACVPVPLSLPTPPQTLSQTKAPAGVTAPAAAATPAALVASEAKAFQSLRASHAAVVELLQRPSQLPFLDRVLQSLYLHFTYEFRY